MAKHKYISQDAAIDAVDVRNLHRGIINALQAIISDIPSADVRPVVRGKWKHINNRCDGYAWQICSECGGKGKSTWNFCPNCGADMREVKADG